MRILRTWSHVEPDARGSVAVIGNFDGVHHGHRAVIARAAEIAAKAGRPLAVVTFEPHPRSYFQPGAAPFRLTPLRPKARQLEALGVDLLFVLTFDDDMAGKAAEAFVNEVLVAGLGVAHVVVGDDFVFGKGRGGNADVLAAAGARLGFGVTRLHQVAGPDGAAYSSTAIRKLLADGKPRDAARVLGRPWEVESHVLPGDKRGRQLGFPTANLDLEGYLLPAFGVYAVRASLDDHDAGGGEGAGWLDGVANLGARPTIGDGKVLLEVHLFDFAEDIYGHLMRVQLIDHIRPEVKFDGLDALSAQIAADERRAREILAGGAAAGVTGAAGRARSPSRKSSGESSEKSPGKAPATSPAHAPGKQPGTSK